MYRELIEKFIKDNQWASVQEPCKEEEIKNAEMYLGFTFPEELKKLLRETNGDNWFLLSAERIIKHVKENREIFPKYIEPDEFEYKVNRFIPFATNGCGDYYGYGILENGETDDSAIYIWEHEYLEFHEVAKNIVDLITKYYNCEL